MTVLRGARMALTLLTRIPAPRASDDDWSGLGAAAPWFPVVGALVGAVTAAALWGLTALLAAKTPCSTFIMFTCTSPYIPS